MGGGGAGFFKPENFGNCLFLSSLYIPGYLTPGQIVDLLHFNIIMTFFKINCFIVQEYLDYD